MYTNYDNYLQHHGIKGMKWGVRRYQNYDGTLTPAGEKRIHKLNTIRDKKAQRAMDKSQNYKQRASKTKYDLNDMKKFGTQSNAWKLHKERKESSRQSQYDWEHGAGTYMGSGKRFFDTLDDALFEKQYFKEYVDEQTKEYNRLKDNAKSWSKRNKDLMSMPITIDTTRRDINRTYNGKWTKYAK